jgi:hypothetical protein
LFRAIKLADTVNRRGKTAHLDRVKLTWWPGTEGIGIEHQPLFGAIR